MPTHKTPTPTPEEEKYVRENHEKIPATEMAKHLNRGAPTIYAWLKEWGLQTCRAKPAPAYTHPFRQKNRGMEEIVKRRNIENRGKPYDGRHYSPKK